MTTDTYRDLMRQGVGLLKGAGIEQPAREARLLLALAADCSAVDLITRELDPVSETGIAERYVAFLKRRVAREPHAHIVGYRQFYGLSMKCDSRALVPRPESEIAVEQALDLLPQGEGIHVADLGTGSGCLLAAILSERCDVRGLAVEQSRAAAALADENFQRLGLQDRVELVFNPWSTWRSWAHADLVISNPPYIRSEDLGGLDPEVRDHDPTEALDGGKDGLAAYREIISLARTHLRPGTPIVLEIGYDQAKGVASLLERAGFFEITVRRDLSGHDRVLSARSPSAKS
ncbi:MAG: peptide chain release factor N(5)-glutamine methyltransferase [Pseudomonadota bacterium]